MSGNARSLRVDGELGRAISGRLFIQEGINAFVSYYSQKLRTLKRFVSAQSYTAQLRVNRGFAP